MNFLKTHQKGEFLKTGKNDFHQKTSRVRPFFRQDPPSFPTLRACRESRLRIARRGEDLPHSTYLRGKPTLWLPASYSATPPYMPTGKAANRDSIRPKVFEEEGGGLEGGGETFYRKFPLPPPISSYIPTAFFRAATSAGVSSRASPGFMTPRRKGPCATRTSRRMVRCRSRHMRRIWRFRP